MEVKEIARRQQDRKHDDVDKDIVFDCIDLEFIASSGLRLILKVLKNAKAEGHHAYIVNMAPNIREAFQLTGFLNLFDQM